MIFLGHIDKVDNHNASQIAQAQLPRNGLGGFQIGFVDSFVKISRTDKATGIDINGGQGFCLVDDQIAT